jgi:hypothetical protein
VMMSWRAEFLAGTAVLFLAEFLKGPLAADGTVLMAGSLAVIVHALWRS